MTRTAWDSVKDRLRATQEALGRSTAGDPARMRDVFRQRAERLAAPAELGGAMQSLTPVLVFRLDEERYGIPLRRVARVFPATAVTPVPGGPEALAGVANLNGEVRSVFELRRLLGLSAGDGRPDHFILLLRQGDRRVGLQVEQVDGVYPVALRDLSRDTAGSPGDRTGSIDGVTADNLIVLRVDTLFARGQP